MKITVQDRHLCWSPYFFLAPQWSPHFSHSRIAAGSRMRESGCLLVKSIEPKISVCVQKHKNKKLTQYNMLVQ